jgi:hypothetical protein
MIFFELFLFALIFNIHVIVVVVLYLRNYEPLKRFALWVGLIFAMLHLAGATLPMLSENLFFNDAIGYPSGGAGSAFEDQGVLFRYFALSAGYTPISSICFLLLALWGAVPVRARVLARILQFSIAVYATSATVLYLQYAKIVEILS